MFKFSKYRKRSILEEPKFSFPEDRKEPELKEGLVNYVHLHFAKRSKLALLFSFIALATMLLSIKFTLDAKGNPELNVSAYVFTSMIFSILGIIYSISSIYEKNTKHILSYLSLILSGTQFLIWFMLIYLGQRG